MALKLKDGLTLYFARHGQTEANVEKRFQGHSKDTPLTAKGIAQARDVGAILRDQTPFAALEFVSSPLKRAQITMEIVWTCWPAGGRLLHRRAAERDQPGRL